jgi:hypothetical protein
MKKKKERSILQKYTWERRSFKGMITRVKNSAKHLMLSRYTTPLERVRIGIITMEANRILQDWEKEHKKARPICHR